MVWLVFKWWKSKLVLYGYRQSHYIHKTDDIYKDFGKGVATRFDNSNYELERPLPKVKKKKKLG